MATRLSQAISHNPRWGRRHTHTVIGPRAFQHLNRMLLVISGEFQGDIFNSTMVVTTAGSAYMIGTPIHGMKKNSVHIHLSQEWGNTIESSRRKRLGCRRGDRSINAYATLYVTSITQGGCARRIDNGTTIRSVNVTLGQASSFQTSHTLSTWTISFVTYSTEFSSSLRDWCSFIRNLTGKHKHEKTNWA